MASEQSPLSLFLLGDVMPGRGIDQILPYPGDPRIYEDYVHDARDYVALAEQRCGPIAHPVDFAYVWGDALAELQRRHPQVRLVNLETAVTRHGRPEPKGINYRMTPENFPFLRAAGINCCTLANNHVLDWGEIGLRDTLDTLTAHGMPWAGAGLDRTAAEAPAILPLDGGRRLLVFAFGLPDSGIPTWWAAGPHQAGVARLDDLSPRSLGHVVELIRAARQSGDRVLVSLHWGDNWAFAVPGEQRAFAHGLIEQAGVDLVHGHSSHHIKGIEVHRGRLILYGCGDRLNDYEGIEGHTAFRGELGLLYFVHLHDDGRLQALEMVPTRLERLRINLAQGVDRRWLYDTLARECAVLGCSVQARDGGAFALGWRA
ncbi:CapA family protein [Pseudomonas oryzae]|uniref:Poly-gamma-glutamate synthesis protein (Capsule biosynthesis protein) n=1 Tax=Pseudomonas oryzae TaxID=1392877 RepID=A0A1H1QXG2_9PSED|nr:CapA family protein [Pseudomonas oryzae]SDS28080.1 poly-gamma-glutamate synthesis protein (capsule biosynthesis protein) [Pseudomonas oryzae]